MSDQLKRILAAKHRRLQAAMEAIPLSRLVSLASESPEPRDFKRALLSGGLAVIAEIKRASPSRGVLNLKLDVRQLVACYRQGGVAAISVLTEQDFFGGSLDDLRHAKQAADLPVLRKDFVFNDYQMWESRATGADAVLLIVKALQPKEIQSLIRRANELNMTALVEVHTETEVKIAVDAGADAIGVNSRNLTDFSVDTEIPLRLAAAIPSGVVKVAESGISSRADMLRIRDAGYNAVLIGQALVQADDPVKKLYELKC